MSARDMCAGTRILAVVLFLGATLVAPPGARADGLGVDWTKFGKETMKSAPAAIQNGSETDKARYLAGKVAEKYESLGVKPNTSLVGRLKAQIKYGDSNVGTCGNLTDALQSTLEGAGFKSDHLVKIVADKSKAQFAADAWSFQARDVVNLNHGALGVAIGGKVWVIDAWHHGLDSKSFKGFDKSPYSLMPLPAWGAQMTKDAYVAFSQEDGSPNPKSYGNINALAAAIENKLPPGGALASGPEPQAAATPARRARPARTDGATPPTGSGAGGRESTATQGLVIWPKLAGSKWSGQINVEESNEDGSAGFTFQLTITIDSGNNIRGSFEFPMAHTDQGPVQQQVPCVGQYDSTTGKLTLTFEKSLVRNETVTALPLVTTVKVEGTMKGGVDPDPNHSDLAQGEFSGRRVVTASLGGRAPIIATTRLKGSWRISRTD